MSVRLERLIRIYNRLRRGPVTIEIISSWAKAAGIKLSDRQLYRDLNSLQHLNIAKGENVVELVSEKNKKTWKLEYDIESDPISQYDINSFFLFKNFVPASIQQHRKESLEKFEQILYKSFSNNKYQKGVEAAELYLRKTNYFDIVYGEKEHEQLEELMWVLQNKRVIIIRENKMASSDKNFELNEFPLTLWPFELLFHQGRVYITGLIADTKILLICLVSQHFKFELTNQTFNRQKNLKKYKEQSQARFGIPKPINGKEYHIKIEFSEGFGLSMQQSFLHETASWKKLKTGNYLLQMKCGINRELIGFLGFSLDKVKVHQPKLLRDLLVKKFANTLELYNGKEVDEERANGDY